MVWSGLAECHRRCGQRCCDNTCSPHPHKTLLRTGNATCWRPIAFRKTLRGHLSLCDGRHPAHFRPLCPLSRAPQPDRIFRPRPHSHRIYHNRTLWHIPRPSLGKTRHCATAIFGFALAFAVPVIMLLSFQIGHFLALPMIGSFILGTALIFQSEEAKYLRSPA